MLKHSHQFNRDDGYNIYCIGDPHRGVQQHDAPKYAAALDAAARDPRGLVLLMGDMCEYRAPDHPFFDWRTTTEYIQGQVDGTFQQLEPLSDKIIGFLTGNHEDGLNRRIGYDPYVTWCNRLHVPYLGNMALIHFKFPNGKGWKVIATHGHGGGRQLGGKVNSAMRFISAQGADAMVQGHNHDPTMTCRHSWKQRTCTRTGPRS
jgi:hypothetical protein